MNPLRAISFSFLFALTLLIPLLALNHPALRPVLAANHSILSAQDKRLAGQHEVVRYPQAVSSTTGLPLLFGEDFESQPLGTLSAADWDYVYSWQVLTDPLDAQNQVLSTSNSDGHYVTARQGEFDWQDQAVSMRSPLRLTAR